MHQPLIGRPTSEDSTRIREVRETLRRYLSTGRRADGTFSEPSDLHIEAMDALLDWATNFDPQTTNDEGIRSLERLRKIDAALESTGLTFDEQRGVFEQVPESEYRDGRDPPRPKLWRRS